MDKKLKNERFRVAIDYLYSKNAISSDKELAGKIGITPASLSRLFNGKKNVSDDTIRKMNDAFDGIFNMAYFRGESEHMIVEDIADAKQKAVSPSTDEPTSNILELYAQMIRGLDDLRQQLKDELAEVKAMKQEYLTARDDFHKAITMLHPSVTYINHGEDISMAAEPESPQKKNKK